MSAEPVPVPFGSRLHQLAHQRGDQTAVIFAAVDGSETTTSWAELDDRATQLARVLIARGLEVGDRLGIRMKNSVEHLIAAFAAWKAGAVPVPVRWDLPDWELQRLLGVLDARIVLTDDDKTAFDAARTESTEPLPDVVPPASSGICSGGSTGSPKVIMRTGPGVYTYPSIGLVASIIAVTPDQITLIPAPLYHNNGFMSTHNLLSGETIVLMERFDAERLLELVERHQVTGFVAATTMLQRVARADSATTRDLSSLQWVMQGASAIPPWLTRAWNELIGGEKFMLCYGSSEGTGVVICRGDEWERHPGTLGRGVVGTELKIIDADGNELPNGDVGEIYMRSPLGGRSHYMGDTPPIPTTADGYRSIGDMGWLDDDGYVYIADRRSDMIVTGGANVFPAEVEAALSEHPGVADVVVIGLADPEWGHRVHAIVQPADQADPVAVDELTAFVKARMAPYKVPKSIEFVPSLPRTEATKINRAQLIAERQAPVPDGSS
jgi:bile acid-coenzyme A ligase